MNETVEPRRGDDTCAVCGSVRSQSSGTKFCTTCGTPRSSGNPQTPTTVQPSLAAIPTQLPSAISGPGDRSRQYRPGFKLGVGVGAACGAMFLVGVLVAGMANGDDAAPVAITVSSSSTQDAEPAADVPQPAPAAPVYRDSSTESDDSGDYYASPLARACSVDGLPYGTTLRNGSGWYGEEADYVSALQAGLRALDYTGLSNSNLIAVDGEFGRHTEKSVMNFQRRGGLPVTGEITASDWESLAQRLAVYQGGKCA